MLASCKNSVGTSAKRDIYWKDIGVYQVIPGQGWIWGLGHHEKPGNTISGPCQCFCFALLSTVERLPLFFDSHGILLPKVPKFCKLPCRPQDKRWPLLISKLHRECIDCPSLSDMIISGHVSAVCISCGWEFVLQKKRSFWRRDAEEKNCYKFPKHIFLVLLCGLAIMEGYTKLTMMMYMYIYLYLGK